MKVYFCARKSFVALLAVFALTSGAAAVARDLPSDLQGEYTAADGEQCGNLFRIDRDRLFGEGMGCEVLSVKRLSGEIGTASNFSVVLTCQMDDPQKPRLSGFLSLNKIYGKWMLGVRLDVEPKLRKKFSYPPLQVFGKCEK